MSMKGFPAVVMRKKVGDNRYYHFYKPVMASKSQKRKGIRETSLGKDEILEALGDGWEYHSTKTNRWYENPTTGEKISRRKALDIATAKYHSSYTKYAEFYRQKFTERDHSVLDNLLEQFHIIHNRYPDDAYLLLAYGKVSPNIVGTDLAGVVVKGAKWSWSYITSMTSIGDFAYIAEYFTESYFEKLQTWYDYITKLQLIRVSFKKNRK